MYVNTAILQWVGGGFIVWWNVYIILNSHGFNDIDDKRADA